MIQEGFLDSLVKTATLLSGFPTVVMAIFTFLQWRINKRLTWFTGAMESHSNIIMMLSAEKEGKKLIWWDPEYRKQPFTKEHGDKVELEEIKIYIPQEYRIQSLLKKKTSK